MTKGLTLFLCGDVMLGRGIDQILPYPGDPRLKELHVGSAKKYLQLAERVSGPIAAPVDFSYVWGDAFDELRRAAPQARIINLETSVTQGRDYAPKGINYKMSPENIRLLDSWRKWIAAFSPTTTFSISVKPDFAKHWTF